MRFVILALLIAGCTGPTPTGAKCPDPDPGTLTYESFGKDFMDRYCVNCHSSTLKRAQRNGAPLYHDFDYFFGIYEVLGHIDEQAGFGPDAHNTFMPGSRCPSVAGGQLDEACPQPTAEERSNLAIWLACEQDRPHNFIDAGVDAAPDAPAGSAQ